MMNTVILIAEIMYKFISSQHRTAGFTEAIFTGNKIVFYYSAIITDGASISNFAYCRLFHVK